MKNQTDADEYEDYMKRESQSRTPNHAEQWQYANSTPKEMNEIYQKEVQRAYQHALKFLPEGTAEKISEKNGLATIVTDDIGRNFLVIDSTREIRPDSNPYQVRQDGCDALDELFFKYQNPAERWKHTIKEEEKCTNHLKRLNHH